MATFLLVHGAWHGAWCWDKVVSALEKAGHKAVAIDLPGHGQHPTPASGVTLDDYILAIGKALTPEREKVVLVGHSMGGMAISGAAEAFPSLVAGLVYVTAFLPRTGESLLSIEERNPMPAVQPAIVPNEEDQTAGLQPDLVIPLFYHDCDDADRALALRSLSPQSLLPLGTPLELTPERFGTVPRFYVECTDDRALGLELQRDMIDASGVRKVYSLAASHSPFFSMPRELAACLIDAAGLAGR